jgi:hypothetical protein
LFFGFIQSCLERLFKFDDRVAVVRVSVPALLTVNTLDAKQLLNATRKISDGVCLGTIRQSERKIVVAVQLHFPRSGFSEYTCGGFPWFSI